MSRKDGYAQRNQFTVRSKVEGRPLYVGVAHEMVHGLRGMEGVQAVPSVYDTYSYIPECTNSPIITQEQAEELRTIGITGSYKYTENKIRREHGLKERRMYNPKQ